MDGLLNDETYDTELLLKPYEFRMDDQKVRESRMKVMAHRGYSGKYPENTMLAFEEAAKTGADWN